MASEEEKPGPTTLNLPETANNALVESIDTVLVELIGVRGKEAVYDNLERNYFINRIAITEHLVELQNLLHSNFGKGAQVIGRSISRRFYSRLDQEFTVVEGFELRDYVLKLRNGVAHKSAVSNNLGA